MKTRKIGAILLIMVMVLTMMPLSAMAATTISNNTSDILGNQMRDPSIVEADGWLYYCGYTTTSAGKPGIFRTKADLSTNRQNLVSYSGHLQRATLLTIDGDWLYFVEDNSPDIKEQSNPPTYISDIVRIKTDGSQRERLRRFEKTNGYVSVSSLQINNGYLYVQAELGFSRMSLSTKKWETLISNINNIWNIYVTNNTVYYSLSWRPAANTTYAMTYRSSLNDFDPANGQPVSNKEKRIFQYCTDGSWLYEIANDNTLSRTKLDGSEQEVILSGDNLAYPTVAGDWVYYYNRNDYCLCRVKKNGTDNQKLVAGGMGSWSYTITRTGKVYYYDAKMNLQVYNTNTKTTTLIHQAL